MLQWVRGPSPPGVFEAACHKVELLALRHQQDKGMNASSPECVEIRRQLFVSLAMTHDVAPGGRRFLDLDEAYHGTHAARASGCPTTTRATTGLARACRTKRRGCRPRA